MKAWKLVGGCILALCGCSGGTDDGCVPNEQDNNGTEVRVCDADGEWGHWTPFTWDACAIPAGNYVVSYTQRNSPKPCPNFPDELVTLTGNGIALGLPSAENCEYGEPVYDFARCQMTAETTCDTQIGGGRSLQQFSITIIDTRRMTAILSTRAMGYDNGVAAYSCQGTYDATITRL